MATCTLPLVINLMVQKFKALDLTINNAPVNVYDGPQGPDEEDNYVVVMGWPGADAPCKHTWAYIGDHSRYENGSIAVVAFSLVGGADDGGPWDPDNAQNQARTNMGYIQGQLEAAMIADPNLATQNGGTAPIVWILQTDITFDETPPEEESSMGRYSQCAMKMSTYNLLGGA